MESYQCSQCDADFKIKHTQNKEYFIVSFCPFCGGDIEPEEEDEELDDYE